MEDEIKRLWAAVLDQAIKDTLDDKGAPKGHESIIAESARAWFSSKSQEQGSFLWICDVLGFDPAAVRDYVDYMGGDQTFMPLSAAAGPDAGMLSQQECRSY